MKLDVTHLFPLLTRTEKNKHCFFLILVQVNSYATVQNRKQTLAIKLNLSLTVISKKSNIMESHFGHREQMHRLCQCTKNLKSSISSIKWNYNTLLCHIFNYHIVDIVIKLSKPCLLHKLTNISASMRVCRLVVVT